MAKAERWTGPLGGLREIDLAGKVKVIYFQSEVSLHGS